MQAANCHCGAKEQEYGKGAGFRVCELAVIFSSVGGGQVYASLVRQIVAPCFGLSPGATHCAIQPSPLLLFAFKRRKA
jgi:hypothetical protein